MQREYILYVSVTFTARNEIRKEKIKIKKTGFPWKFWFRIFRDFYLFIYIYFFGRNRTSFLDKLTIRVGLHDDRIVYGCWRKSRRFLRQSSDTEWNYIQQRSSLWFSLWTQTERTGKWNNEPAKWFRIDEASKPLEFNGKFQLKKK
jgi:hypothetical protein